MSAEHDGNDGISPAAKTASEISLLGPRHRLLAPDPNPDPDGNSAAESRPLAICFHGSGGSCSPAWDSLASTLTSAPYGLRVLLYERGPLNPKPPQATADLCAYLKSEGLRGPCVLIGHSYGGAFARTFLEEADAAAATGSEHVRVVGLVLVETGQEGGLDAAIEERQYERRVLGFRPLSVIRGNSLLRMWQELKAAEAAVKEDDGRKKEEFRRRREMLRTWDEAEEKMKKKQLELAAEMGRKRYVHIPDCGHDVVRDRPDVVAAEVGWVLENMDQVICDEEKEQEHQKPQGCEKGGKGRRIDARRFWKAWRETIGKLFGRLRR
ncbi:Alpha/Beta hydrolase protein [Hypomontagnella submonticulosa]|nr:Alpha/Beta hydrolase protein [Hypomontagnella submonticulosa]